MSTTRPSPDDPISHLTAQFSHLHISAPINAPAFSNEKLIYSLDRIIAIEQLLVELEMGLQYTHDIEHLLANILVHKAGGTDAVQDFEFPRQLLGPWIRRNPERAKKYQDTSDQELLIYFVEWSFGPRRMEKAETVMDRWLDVLTEEREAVWCHG
jgi:hypothetical protein